MTPDSEIYTATRTFSGALGVANRVINATVAARRVGAASATSTVSVSTVANMADDELTDYQTFVGGLDEEATALKAVLDGIA